MIAVGDDDDPPVVEAVIMFVIHVSLKFEPRQCRVIG